MYQPLHEKGKAIKSAGPAGVKVYVSPPGKHFSSAAVLGEGEDKSDGLVAEGQANFQLRSRYQSQQEHRSVSY